MFLGTFFHEKHFFDDFLDEIEPIEPVFNSNDDSDTHSIDSNVWDSLLETDEQDVRQPNETKDEETTFLDEEVFLNEVYQNENGLYRQITLNEKFIYLKKTLKQ